MDNIAVFVFNDVSVDLEEDFVNLTKLWEMTGTPEEQRPSDWSHLPVTKKLISQVLTEQGFQNTEKSGIIKTKRGKGGGTFAHWKLALDYAGYLSPALKSQFYDWIKDRIKEEINPDLALDKGIDRAVVGWQRQGRSDEWIQQRLKGIGARHTFTSTLQKHGVDKGYQYGACTNEIYKPILGGEAQDIKEERGIKHLRDGLSRVELAAIDLAEAIASESMEQENIQGFSNCRSVCSRSGLKVKRVFE